MSLKCSACFVERDLLAVRTTNGVLTICKQCLESVFSHYNTLGIQVKVAAVIRETEAFIAANCECKGAGKVWPLDSDYPKPCLDCRALRAALKAHERKDQP